MKGTRQKRLDGLTERIKKLIWASDKPMRQIEHDIFGDDRNGHNVIYRWMGGSQPSAYYLAAVCRYFKCDANRLLGLTEDTNDCKKKD